MAEADAATASVIAVLRTSLTRPAQRTSSRDTLIGASAPVLPALQRGILGAQSRRCPTSDVFLSHRLHNLARPSAGGVTQTPAVSPLPHRGRVRERRPRASARRRRL